MYICSNCGNESLKRQGQCNFCKEWNSLIENKEIKISNNNGNNIKGEIKELTSINSTNELNEIKKISTKSSELNNVMGGGITPGGITLLSGEPGIGKSTIALELANLVDNDIIYISGEETTNQIASRAKRLGIKGGNIKLLSENSIENIIETLTKCKTDILIIDSISVIHSKNINSVAGSVSQVKYITELLVTYGKKTNTAVIIIGHVNKDGNLAGPKTLEHMVDTVIFFEGEKYDDLRFLRPLKNRFGSTSEIGIFKMDEKGLKDIKNPGLEFVSSLDATVGSSLSITIEGTKSIVIETECLTTYTKFGYPKRSARGINSSKLDLIIAVLSKYTGISLESYDVYSNISRGLKIEEPGIDLSLAASIISSKINKVLPKDSIFIGEISLTGKIKNISHIDKRIKEAEKMGFKKIYTPNIKDTNKGNIEIIKLSNVQELTKKINEL